MENLNTTSESDSAPNPNLSLHLNGGPPSNILKKQSSYHVGVDNASCKVCFRFYRFFILFIHILFVYHRRSGKTVSYADDHGEVIQ